MQRIRTYVAFIERIKAKSISGGTHLVDVRAAEVAVQRRLEVERARAGVRHGQLGLKRGSLQLDLQKNHTRVRPPPPTRRYNHQACYERERARF